jgi:hypothetical protein
VHAAASSHSKTQPSMGAQSDAPSSRTHAQSHLIKTQDGCARCLWHPLTAGICDAGVAGGDGRGRRANGDAALRPHPAPGRPQGRVILAIPWGWDLSPHASKGGPQPTYAWSTAGGARAKRIREVSAVVPRSLVERNTTMSSGRLPAVRCT